MLPAVRALCSRSAARLRYLSYSATKPQAPRKRRCASPRAHCNGGSAGAAHPQPEKQSGLRGEGEGRERGRREGREKEEEREKAEGKGREGAGEEGGGKEEERGEGKEGAGSERPTAQGFDECDKYIESLSAKLRKWQATHLEFPPPFKSITWAGPVFMPHSRRTLEHIWLGGLSPQLEKALPSGSADKAARPLVVINLPSGSGAPRVGMPPTSKWEESAS